MSTTSANSEGVDDPLPRVVYPIQKVGVLGVVVLLLSVSTFLVRRKEREPDET